MCILSAHSYSYSFVLIWCTRNAHGKITEQVRLLTHVHMHMVTYRVMCMHTHTISVCMQTMHADCMLPWLHESFGGEEDCDWNGDKIHSHCVLQKNIIKKVEAKFEKFTWKARLKSSLENLGCMYLHPEKYKLSDHSVYFFLNWIPIQLNPHSVERPFIKHCVRARILVMRCVIDSTQKYPYQLCWHGLCLELIGMLYDMR